jgi:4'-phosphopantetheinyl transferase
MGRSADPASLRQGEIHVWTAQLLDDDDVAAGLIGVLDEDEKARAARFRFAQHRRHFVQSHGMMRRVLAAYAGIDAAALTFRYNPHGKPSLAHPAHDLHFSLSHSADCCMLAIRRGNPIGIDVEQLRDLPDVLDVARRQFTRSESQLLSRLPAAARRDAFFALWTQKEAIVKALGGSLADYLDRLEFDLGPAGGVRLVSRDGDRSVGDQWSVVRIDCPRGYAAAMATCHGFRELAHFAWKAGLPPRLGQQSPRRDIVMRSMADIRRPGL